MPSERARLRAIREIGAIEWRGALRPLSRVHRALFARARRERWPVGKLAIAILKAYPADELEARRRARPRRA
jgi:hypothetical protein